MEIYAQRAVPPEVSARLRAMPKVEIHIHLEGSMDPETIWELARRNGVKLPAASLEEWRRFYAFRDFDHFVEVYVAASRCMRTAADYTFMVERFLQHQAAQDVRYCEAFLSMSLQHGKLSEDEFIAAIAEGAARGERKYGTRVRFIPDISRELPHTQDHVVDAVINAASSGIVIGLGLGGPEPDFPPEMYIRSFEKARRAGLHVVAHAGETAGPESIRGAVFELQAERIGHGIRVLDDPELTAELRRRQIPFEVSPTSNYAVRIVPPDQLHPIRRMVEAGLYCTVNSDDPPMFGTTLNQEYERLYAQGFSVEELTQLNRNALEATFLSEEEKIPLRHELAMWERNA